MLIKYARSTSAAEVISGGESSTKIAGIAPQVREFITGIKPDDNTYMLSTAMSYSEFFGPNSNNDYYGHNPHLGYNGLLHAWENIGKSVDNDRRKGREWSHGYPCFYDATVYAHHRNTDPKTLGFGDIIFAFANPAMRRIELVHRIFDAIARERGHGHFLDRLDRGERVDTSMGAKVPFDLCSIETDWDRVRRAKDRYDPKRHKHWGDAVLEEHIKSPISGLARTRAEYGPHMRSRAGKVLEDGRQVFVYNDIPRFFDNSLVIVGADRTAKSMWHLPAKKPHNAPLVTAALEALSGLKLGEMTKRIGPRPGIRGEVMALAPHHDKRAALATLAHVGICCTPEEFSLLVLGAPVSFKAAQAIDYVLSPDPLDVSTALVPRIYAGTAPVDLPVKVASGELEQSLGAMYTGYRLGAIRNATALFAGPIKIASSRGGFLLQESTVIDWLSPVGIAPGENHMALMSAVTSSKDLEKISMALDAVIRTKKTSMWAALDEVAELTAYM